MGLENSWDQMRLRYPEVLRVDRDEILEWHRSQAFDALVDIFNLPERSDDDQFQLFNDASTFHLLRVEEMSGEVDTDFRQYLGTIQGIVRKRREDAMNEQLLPVGGVSD